MSGDLYLFGLTPPLKGKKVNLNNKGGNLTLTAVKEVFIDFNVFRQIVALCVKLILIAAGGVLVWRLGVIFFRAHLGIITSYYTSNYIWYDTSSFSAFWDTFTRFIDHFIQRRVLFQTSWLPIDMLIWAASMVLLVSSIILSVVWKKRWLWMLGLIVTGSAYAFMFITGNAILNARVNYTFSALVAISCAFLYMASKGIIIKNFKIRFLVLLFIVSLIFNQSRVMNQLFLINHQTYQQDLLVMNTILHDLGGLEKEKYIVFIGFLPNHPSMSDYISGSIGGRFFNWIRSAGGDREIQSGFVHDFFGMHGYQTMGVPHHLVERKEEIKANLQGMEMWPRDGYIREFDDYVIVRLGPSPTFDVILQE